MKALLFSPVSKNLFLTFFAIVGIFSCVLLFQNCSGPVSQHFRERTGTNTHHQEAYGYDEAEGQAGKDKSLDTSALSSK